jgi:hypothetical protein
MYSVIISPDRVALETISHNLSTFENSRKTDMYVYGITLIHPVYILFGSFLSFFFSIILFIADITLSVHFVPILLHILQ